MNSTLVRLLLVEARIYYTVCAQIIRGLNSRRFRGPDRSRPRNFGQRCCVIVKMDVERTRTMPHCSTVAFAASVGSNTTDASLLIS